MVAGTKNEQATLRSLQGVLGIEKVYECGLLESKTNPWLAASPNAIAVFIETDGSLQAATVEVKSRDADATIKTAMKLKSEYGQFIECVVGDEMWGKCVPRSHSTQMIVQSLVTQQKYLLYVASMCGSANRCRQIIYIVKGLARGALFARNYHSAVYEKLFHYCDNLLGHFFMETEVRQLMPKLPATLDVVTRDVIRTRWPLFVAMRTKIMGLDDESISFPSCQLMKSAAQSVYNSLKGGLDANTQQYRAICPKLNTSFECKFIIRMLLAIVTNSWRAMSLLQNGPDILERKLNYFQIRILFKEQK